MWTDPLIISAVLAIALWIAGYIILKLVKLGEQSEGERRPSLLSLLKGTLLLVAAIPAFCVGFVPAIIWGLKHQWQNMAYIFNNGSDIASSRLTTIVHIQPYYNTCIAPRIIGGAFPPPTHVTCPKPPPRTLGLRGGVSS